MLSSHRRFRTAIPALVSVALLSASLLAVAQSPADAAAFNCTGKDPQHILARYGYSASGAEYPVPLRCGNSSWGYKHFSSRWSNSFESHLERTLNNPTVRKLGGTTRVVCRKVNASADRKWFKVVHTTYTTNDNQGIITAVWESSSGSCEKL